MWSLWKEVLCRGTQRDRFGRWFTVGPREIADARRNAAAMLGRGVPVPCVWEHLDVEAGDSEEWKARYAKHTFAHVGGARINGRGNLELRHDGRDPKDRDQLLKTKFVSPKVYPFYSDSRGGEYRGTTVAHVAATPTPIQSWQKPFELSRADALYLSYSPEDSTVADEAGDKGKGGTGGDLSALIEALKGTGMNIPDEVTDISGLIIAVKASGGAGGGGDLDLDDDTDTDTGSGGADDTTSAGGPPMLMSATDPRVKGYAINERREFKRRVNRLFQTGRVDRPTAQKLLRGVEAVELSFTRTGDLVAPKVAHQIEAFEMLPKGTVWNRDGKRPADHLELSTAEVDAPGSLTGGDGLNEVIKRQEELAAQYSTAPREEVTPAPPRGARPRPRPPE